MCKVLVHAAIKVYFDFYGCPTIVIYLPGENYLICSLIKIHNIVMFCKIWSHINCLQCLTVQSKWKWEKLDSHLCRCAAIPHKLWVCSGYSYISHTEPRAPLHQMTWLLKAMKANMSSLLFFCETARSHCQRENHPKKPIACCIIFRSHEMLLQFYFLRVSVQP